MAVNKQKKKEKRKKKGLTTGGGHEHAVQTAHHCMAIAEVWLTFMSNQQNKQYTGEKWKLCDAHIWNEFAHSSDIRCIF